MKTTLAPFLCLILLCLSSMPLEAASGILGSSEEVVIKQFGRPTSFLSNNAKTILIYPQGRITLSNDQVVSVSGEFEFDSGGPATEEATPESIPQAEPVTTETASVEKPVTSDKKIPSSFRWSTMLTEAKSRSEASGLPILALFTGPDWCPPCIQLEKEVLPRTNFKEYVRTNFIPLKVALYQRSPQSAASKEQYETLNQRYGIKGVPSFAILSADAELLGKPNLSKQYSGASNREEHVIAAIKATDGSSKGMSFYVKIGLAVIVLVILYSIIKK